MRVLISCVFLYSMEAFKNHQRKQVSVPLVADIHFDYKIALAVADLGADCLRINPGNIGSGQIREVVAAARHNDISMRIGVNAGSLKKKTSRKIWRIRQASTASRRCVILIF